MPASVVLGKFCENSGQTSSTVFSILSFQKWLWLASIKWDICMINIPQIIKFNLTWQIKQWQSRNITWHFLKQWLNVIIHCTYISFWFRFLRTVAISKSASILSYKEKISLTNINIQIKNWNLENGISRTVASRYG